MINYSKSRNRLFSSIGLFLAILLANTQLRSQQNVSHRAEHSATQTLLLDRISIPTFNRVEQSTTTGLLQRTSPPPLRTPTLAILVEFSDAQGVGDETVWNERFFAPSNSVQDYYREVSYFVEGVRGHDMHPAKESSGNADNGIAGWYQITWGLEGSQYNEHPATVAQREGAGDWEMSSRRFNEQIAVAAIRAADADIQFSTFDADTNGYISSDELHVVIVLAGFELTTDSERALSTWRHHTALRTYNNLVVDGVRIFEQQIPGSDVGGGFCLVGEVDYQRRNESDPQIEFGLIAHELGHDLGLPDLYDTDSSNGNSAGIGQWGLMAYGDGLGERLGSTPAHLCAWSKTFLKWIEPVVVNQNVFSQRISRIEDNPEVFLLPIRGPNFTSVEYFLIENRQRIMYDRALPGDGLLIWHIDPTKLNNGDNNDETHKLVDLECADQTGIGHTADADPLDLYDRGLGTGSEGTEGNPWYSGNKSDFRVFDLSVPDSRDYQDRGSYVEVNNISASGEIMTADLIVEPLQSTQPTQLSASVMPSAIAADGQSTAVLSAQLLNQFNQVVPGATNPVTFTINNGASSATLIGANPATPVQGVASIQLQSTLTSGTVTVEASSPGLTSSSATVTVFQSATTVGGPITANTTWDLAGSPYEVTSDVTVYNRAVLTIEPGITVLFHSGTQLRIANGNNAGSLIANGTQANSILFTSFSGSRNDWKGIVFDDGSDNGVTSSMTWCTVEKAGQNNSYGIPAELYFRRTRGVTISNSTIGLPISEPARGVYSIYCTESSPTISNNTINNSGGNALVFLIANSNPSISNNSLRGSGNPYWIFADNNNCNPTLSGNTFTGTVTTPLRVGPMAIISGNIFSGTFTPGIEIIAGQMSESRTWSKQVGNAVYVVVAGGNRNDVHVFREGGYPVLTIESGIVVRFAGTGIRIASQGSSSFLRYPGGLLINGTSAEPVRLTSYSGSPGGWRGVTFDRDSDVNISSSLSYCSIENTGQANSFGLTAALHFFGSRNSVTMTNCTIQSNSGSSLSMNESNISFTKGKINQNSAYPVIDLSGSSLTLSHTEIKNDFSGGEAILKLMGGSYANLDNNEVYAMGGPYWIKCEDNASNVDLYGNTFGGAVSHPLRIGPNSNILGNTFTGSFLSGMEIIAGTIASSRTWSKQNGDSVYVIVSGGAANDLHIYREGGRPILTIESGIVVRFAGTGLRIGSFGASSFLRYPGGLVVNGTTDQPVKLTSLTGNRSGWKGIIFDRDSDSNITSSLSFCIIENAGQGNFFNSNAAIYFRQTNGISLNNCTIQNNGGYGIHTNASSPHVANSLITNNGIHGIFVEGNSRPIIGNSLTTGNDIVSNNLYDLYNSSANTIEARYNYWGTTDRNQIASRIFDKADNPAFGEVIYEPWTDSSHVSVLPDNLPPVNPDRALAWSDASLQIQLFEDLAYAYPNPHFAWRAATDNSLVIGYAVSFTPDSIYIPPPVINVRDTFYTVQQPLIANRTFYLRLRARDGAGNWNQPSTLFRYQYAPQENHPPSAPLALLPTNGAELRPDGLLVWTEATDPDFGDIITYSLHIDDDSTFATPIINAVNVEGSAISASSLAEDDGSEDGTGDDAHHDAATNVVAARLDTLAGNEQLRDDTIYFWRVQARDHRGGVSAFSTVRSFFFNKLNTAPGPVTDGFSPRASLEVRTSQPTLSWHTANDPDLSDHAGTLRYHLELNTANDFSAPRFNYTTQPGIASIEIPDSLAENARWFWRVRTRDAGDLFSAWSTVHDFWVNAIDEPPLPFTLIAPTNHALVTSETIEFRWQTTFDHDPQDRLRYIFEFSSDSLFRSHQQRLVLTDTSHTASFSAPQEGIYYWRVQCVDSDSLITWASGTDVTPWRFEVRIVDVDDVTGGLPTSFALQQNYPNPFNPETRIRFSLPQASQVRLEVHNLLGQRIAVLLDESRAPGEYSLSWQAVDASGRRVPSGIYILSLHASDPVSGRLRFAQTRKMVVVE